MFDISTLAVKDTFVLELENSDGERLVDEAGNPRSITVYGLGSKQYQEAQAKRNLALLEFMKKGNKKGNSYEQRKLDAEFLATCTASFNNFAYKDFTGYEMFKAAYLDASIGFISDQVNKAIGDWANFTKESDKA